jgi:hypothetical protein
MASVPVRLLTVVKLNRAAQLPNLSYEHWTRSRPQDRDYIVYNIGGFVGAIAGGQALPLIFLLDGIGVYLRLLVASVLLFGSYGSYS